MIWTYPLTQSEESSSASTDSMSRTKSRGRKGVSTSILSTMVAWCLTYHSSGAKEVVVVEAVVRDLNGQTIRRFRSTMSFSNATTMNWVSSVRTRVQTSGLHYAENCQTAFALLALKGVCILN